jgi:hypothetical protein
MNPPRDLAESIREIREDPVGVINRQQDEITRLQARVAELEGALEPFAKLAPKANVSDELQLSCARGIVTVGDLRRAASVLEGK